VGGAAAKHPTLADRRASTQRDPSCTPTRQDGGCDRSYGCPSAVRRPT